MRKPAKILKIYEKYVKFNTPCICYLLNIIDSNKKIYYYVYGGDSHKSQFKIGEIVDIDSNIDFDYDMSGMMYFSNYKDLNSNPFEDLM